MLRMASVASKWWNNIIIILINIAFNCADELCGAEVNAGRESIKLVSRLQLIVSLADYIKKQINNYVQQQQQQGLFSKFMLLRAMMSNLLLLLMQNKINNRREGKKHWDRDRDEDGDGDGRWETHIEMLN